jgi:site-specific DNA recombinase
MSKAKKIINSSFGKTGSSNNLYENREGLVYARVSSMRQTTEGSGLESQDGRCIKELEVLNIPYIKTFPDSFSGGGDFMKRPAMRELLEYIDAHPHKKYVVVFDDLSRFARDVIFHIKLRAEFKKRDVILRCLNYNFDESEEGEFVELVFAGKYELDRKQNRRQVIQKQKSRLELGYWAFGSKKGYTMTRSSEHGTISISNKDGEILKEALEGFSTGRFIRKIDACRFLVEKGFWKNQSPEKYIDKFTELIKDPFYPGFIEYPAWEVSRRIGKHKGIITLETFELNKKRLGKFDFGKRIRTDITDDFPIRGLQNCADCGHHITSAWIKGRHKRHPYYYCQNKNCPSYWKVIQKEIIESQFIKLLKKTTLKKDVSKIVKVVFDKVWTDEVQNITKTQNDLKFKKADLEKKISELTNLVISAKTEPIKRAYESQIEPLSEEIENISSNTPITDIDLSIPYRTALNKAMGMLKSPYDVWVSLDTREQQSLFYFIFEKKLLYSRNEGYRTAELPSAVRLFEEFATSETLDVEMAGIEPACRKLLH